MNFILKETEDKKPYVYKTIYIKQRLFNKIEHIAATNQTSWDKVVISIIENCLEKNQDKD